MKKDGNDHKGRKVAGKLLRDIEEGMARLGDACHQKRKGQLGWKVSVSNEELGVSSSLRG